MRWFSYNVLTFWSLKLRTLTLPPCTPKSNRTDHVDGWDVRLPAMHCTGNAYLHRISIEDIKMSINFSFQYSKFSC